jgi:glycosyltransferase involved in cell wall biosynthesis
MKLLLVTDAWHPQVNGVVTTLVELLAYVKKMGHEVEVIEPSQFKTRPCPGYAGIDLAISPKKQVIEIMQRSQADYIHIATEGPLGWAARSYCIKNKLAFTTAFHTKFPEILKAAIGLPVWLGYMVFRYFHKASAGVMVPTVDVFEHLEKWRFKNLRSWTHGVDTHLFQYQSQALIDPMLGEQTKPVSLFVGRLSYEKNIEAFLKLDLPGSKVVVGVGPVEKTLKEKYPNVKWLGILKRPQLAKIYASADVLVFPSKADTFGLVMLEAMACGTPVAAFPVDGPLAVLGDDPSNVQGGVMDNDLKQAWIKAIKIPRWNARQHAERFSWDKAGQQFIDFLVPAVTRSDPNQAIQLDLSRV